MLTLDKIYQASYVLKPVIRRTDLIYAPRINPNCQIYLKPEKLQVPSRSEALALKFPNLPRKKNNAASWHVRQEIMLKGWLCRLPPKALNR